MNSSNQVIFKKPPLPSHIRPPPPPGYEQVKADVTFSTEGSKGNEASGAAQGSGGRRSRGRGMAEPRARAARHKGQLNFGNELKHLLFAYGDTTPEPLPETLRVLDEIVTDFIIETCHAAASGASHARRQKIKVDDFRFVLRKSEEKLGRVNELLRMERELKEARKAFDGNDDRLGGEKGVIAGAGLEDGGRGKKREAAGDGEDGDGEGTKRKGRKKRKSA